MATAKKRGNKWRVLVYIGEENGKRKYKSFTSRDKKQAEFDAAAYLVERQRKSTPGKITVKEAIEQYISNKTAVLSPSTVRCYTKCSALYLQSISGVRLENLTQALVQEAVNIDARTKSPKTVRNAHGLLTAALAEAIPDFVLRTKLPPKQKPKIDVPEKEQVQHLINLAKGNRMETVIMIASTLGLRRSEICALTWGDIDLYKNTLQINKAMVRNKDGAWVLKAPKSYAGARTIDMPAYLQAYLKERVRDDSERVVSINPDCVSNYFAKLRKRCGLTFRFHDLRHPHVKPRLKYFNPAHGILWAGLNLSIFDTYELEICKSPKFLNSCVFMKDKSAKRRGSLLLSVVVYTL